MIGPSQTQGAPVRSSASVPRRRGLVILLSLTLLVAVSAAFCQVWTRLYAIECGYRISRATAEHARLQEQNRRLKLELALLKSPARIKAIAVDQLGMSEPRPEQIRRLRAGGQRSGQEPIAGRPGTGRNDS